MAYDSTNLQLKQAQIGRAHSTAGFPFGGNHWWYRSTADGTTSVVASSYFSDGYKRGMRKYDTVEFVDISSTQLHFLTVTSVTTSGGATVTSVLSTA
jgi:hypothetical protein